MILVYHHVSPDIHQRHSTVIDHWFCLLHFLLITHPDESTQLFTAYLFYISKKNHKTNKPNNYWFVIEVQLILYTIDFFLAEQIFPWQEFFCLGCTFLLVTGHSFFGKKFLLPVLGMTWMRHVIIKEFFFVFT